MRKIVKIITVLVIVAIVVAAVYYLTDVKDGVNWLAAIGTIVMTFIITLIEVIKPWIQKPEIKIEFKNDPPFCRDCLIEVNVKTPAPGYKGPAFGYFIRLKIRNIGGSLAKNLRGKLVKVINRDGEIDTDFDPLFLHWVSIPRIKRVELDPFEKWLDPIDLNVGEWEYLHVFNTLEKLEKKEDWKLQEV